MSNPQSSKKSKITESGKKDSPRDTNIYFDVLKIVNYVWKFSLELSRHHSCPKVVTTWEDKSSQDSKHVILTLPLHQPAKKANKIHRIWDSIV